MLSLRDKTDKHYEEHRLIHQKLTKIYLAIRVHDLEILDRMLLDGGNVKVLPLELKTNSNENVSSGPGKWKNTIAIHRKDPYDPYNTQKLRINDGDLDDSVPVVLR
jgi:hypothetical protein